MKPLKFIFTTIFIEGTMLFSLWHSLPPGRLLVTFFDIGQGDAILITTPGGHHILVDGGPTSLILSRLGETLPYFNRKIDLIVLTHPHKDHLKGLVDVLERYPVGGVLGTGMSEKNSLYEAFFTLIHDKNIPFITARASQDYEIDGVRLDVVFPPVPVETKLFKNANNSSVVIQLAYGARRILLEGDLEKEGEAILLSEHLDLKSDILKAGHHGSRTSSTGAFLDAVQPELTVLSAGDDNSYHHPHPETLYKLKQRGIEIWRTDTQGTLTVECDEQNCVRQ